MNHDKQAGGNAVLESALESAMALHEQGRLDEALDA